MQLIWRVIKLFLYGLVEGITEWLPVSSTGHLLILEEFLPLNFSESFLSFFRIAIQLAAILAVVIYFWQEIWPFKRLSPTQGHLVIGKKGLKTKNPVLLPLGKFYLDRETTDLWLKILVAIIPAGLVGFFFDDFFEAHFYNPLSVALALIIVGLIFLITEYWNKDRQAKFHSVSDISWKMALIIGLFQMIAGVFPGVSRSGACILGGLLLGLSRPAASAFSFYLAIPVMFGASFLKLMRVNLVPSSTEVASLILASAVAFITSLLTIRFFLNYVKKNSFNVFAIYRIILGLLVLGLFVL